MAKGIRRASYIAIVIATLGSGTAAMAQKEVDPAPAANSADTTDGDIIVTAQRKEERLQDVPLSISAISGDSLKDRAIVDVASLAKVAPGMNVTASPRGSATPFLILRGQRLLDTTMVLDAPVLFYVNDVPWMRVNGLNLALYDVDSVQILRGPQGTLFGKSTTGGAVLVTTKKASTTGLEGYVQATGGTYSLVRLEGAVNVPLSDNLAIRFAGTAARRDGYMKSRNLGNDLNNEKYDAQRVSVRYDNGNIVNDLVFNRIHSSNNGTATPITDLNVAAATPSRVAALQAEIALNRADFYSVGNDFPLYEKTKTYDVTNTTSITLNDNLTLKNTISYRDINAPVAYDIDGSSVVTRRFFSYTKAHQFSNELQLQGKSDSFDWIVGAFYLNEKGDDGSFIYDPPFTVPSQSAVEAQNKSYSAFVSATYRFPIEGLSASAGFRISHDDRAGSDIQTSGPLGGACNFTLSNGTKVCSYRMTQSSTKPSWSASLNYKVTPDLMLYVAHRHGYRSGGVQNRATTQAAAVPFNPETVNDVELGAKYSGRIGDDASLTVNVAGYRDWYKDLQRVISFVTPSGVIAPGFTNAADAIIQGVEGEVTLKVSGFRVGGSFGYTDAFYKAYTQNLTTTVSQDLSATPFGFVPKWTYDLRAGYEHALGGADEVVAASIELHHVDRVFVGESPQAIPYLPSYSVVNAGLRWSSVGGSGVDLAANVTNLFEKKYATYANNYSSTQTLGYFQPYPAPPRRFEASVAIHF